MLQPIDWHWGQKVKRNKSIFHFDADDRFFGDLVPEKHNGALIIVKKVKINFTLPLLLYFISFIMQWGIFLKILHHEGGNTGPTAILLRF